MLHRTEYQEEVLGRDLKDSTQRVAGALGICRSRRLNADWWSRIDRILNALDLARNPADMDLPGFRLHPLTGDYMGFYAVDVSGNWRIVFRFEGADTTDIDLIDYH